jgi:hypothetical protein
MTIEAYEPPPPNDLVRPVAMLMLLTITGVGIAGWLLSEHQVAVKAVMSWLTAVIEIWAFNASAQWARALKREAVENERGYWAAIMLGCALFSLASVLHGLNVLTGGFGLGTWFAYLSMGILSVMVPFAMWAIEGVEKAELARAASARKDRSERTGWRRKVVGAGAMGALAASAGGAEAIAQPPAQPPRVSPPSIVQMADAQAVQREKVARARRLHSEGVNKTEIGRRLGVHRNTVREWIKAA